MSAEPVSAAAPLPDSASGLVHEYLVVLAFRFHHVTEGAPDRFGDFEAGSGVRTPSFLVRHMTGLILWVADQYAPGAKTDLAELSFRDECTRFLDAVRDLDRAFAASTRSGASLADGDGAALAPSASASASELTFDQLWRGPLTDAMTHVGQLATLRRLAGDPVDRVRYWQVDMPPLRDR